MKYLFEGLQILMKYWPEVTDANAQTDVLYIGGDKSLMGAEDVAALEAIRHWHYNEEFDCWAYYT